MKRLTVVLLSLALLHLNTQGIGDYSLCLVIHCSYIVVLVDPAVEEAAKVIRLLHLHELRDLQTQINKAIVLVQKLTANPKTDQSLGKVGR